MKKILLSCLGLLLGSVALSAQNEMELLQISVANAKGKTISKALISFASSPLYRQLDFDGTLTFRPMPGDTVFVTSGSYKFGIPAKPGQTKMDIRIDKEKAYEKYDPKTVYPGVKLPSFNTSKLYLNPDILSYGTVSNLIRLRYPAIALKKMNGYTYAVLNANPTRTSSSGTTELNSYGGEGGTSVAPDPNSVGAALMMVDGKQMGSFEAIDRLVPLSTVVSITYEKPDIVLGKGGNGKVFIRTLAYKEPEI